MSSRTKRRIFITGGVVVALYVIFALLHFLPVTNSYSMTRHDRHEFKAAARLAHHGHLKAARRHAGKVKHKLHVHVNVKRLRNYPHAHGVHHCQRVPRVGTASVLGAHMFSATMSQRFCWNGHKVTRHGRVSVDTDVTTLGEAFNWSSDGVIESGHSYVRPHRRVFHTFRVVRFHDCVPTPVGCQFPQDHDIHLNTYYWGDGRTWPSFPYN